MPFRLIPADIGRLVSKRDLGGLIAALESEDKNTRWMAAGGLGELRDPRAIDPLIRALADPDPDVRWKAVEALGSIGDARATEALIPFLTDPDDTVRLQVVWALGRIRDQRATTHLIPFLVDPDYDVKIAAIWALGGIGGRHAARVLREMLLDRHSGVRSKVAESLEMCGWRPADDRERGALAFARRDWGEVSRYRRALADVLVWALDDGYFDVRMHAARILVHEEPARCRPLRKALDDPEECVTYEAAAALAEIGNPESRQALVHGLESPHLGTRKVAAGALRRLGWEPRSLYHKVLFLSANDDWVGLVRLKRHGVGPLARELTERRGAERTSIAKALRAIGSPATDALVGLLKNPDPDIRWRAASILGDGGDRQAVGPLVAALEDTDGRVASSAALALGELRDEEAVDPLIRAYRTGNPDLSRDSVAALGRIGSRRAVAAIIEASGDESPDVRLSAIRAMGRIGDVRVLLPCSRSSRPGSAVRFEAGRRSVRTPAGNRPLISGLGRMPGAAGGGPAGRQAEGEPRSNRSPGSLKTRYREGRQLHGRLGESAGDRSAREQLAYLIAKEE